MPNTLTDIAGRLRELAKKLEVQWGPTAGPLGRGPRSKLLGTYGAAAGKLILKATTEGAFPGDNLISELSARARMGSLTDDHEHNTFFILLWQEWLPKHGWEPNPPKQPLGWLYADAMRALAGLLTDKTQPPAETTAATKRLTTNALMVLTLEKSPEAANWSITQWQTKIDRGRATIQGTEQWKRLQAAHALVKVDRLTTQEQARGLQRRGSDGGRSDRRKQGHNLD